MPESNNEVIPRTSKRRMRGFRIVWASQRIPRRRPRKNVDPYSTVSPTNVAKWVSPDSRTATPRKSDKNRGAATGNNRQSTGQAMTADSISEV